MTPERPQPGDARRRLDRAPSDRYRPPAVADARDDPLARVLWPLAVVLGGAVGYVVLGGWLTVTAGLVIVAAFVGWLIGRLVSPPWLAALVAVGAVVVGLVGVWLFGRLEGGVLDPLTYLDEVQGPLLVGLQLVAGGGMAAAASR